MDSADDYTPVMLAAYADNVETLKKLCSKGADPSEQNWKGESAWTIASDNHFEDSGNSQCFNFLKNFKIKTSK